MDTRKPPQAPNARPKSKTPAERSVEFEATQRRLKEEAAARRNSAKPAEPATPPPSDS
jgi:hypothetical protein